MLSFGINIKTKNKMAAKNSVTDAVAGTIKPPISFKEFAKEPVKGLLFISALSAAVSKITVLQELGKIN